MSEELQSSMTSTSDYEVDDAGASSPVVSTINQLTPPSLNATQTETNPAVTPTNPTPETVRRGVWGATAAMRWAKKAKAKKIEENSEKSTLKSVAKRVNKQMKARTIITRWAHMSPMGRFAKDEEHLTFIREATRQVSMDIPAPIQHCIREEVLVILQVRRIANIRFGLIRLISEN